MAYKAQKKITLEKQVQYRDMELAVNNSCVCLWKWFM